MEHKIIWSFGVKIYSSDESGETVRLVGVFDCGVPFQTAIRLVSLPTFLNSRRFHGDMYKGVFYVKDYHPV